VQNPEFYGVRAQQNSIKSVPILAPRGAFWTAMAV